MEPFGKRPAGRRTRVAESSGDRVTWTYDPTSQLTGEYRSGANGYRTSFVYDPSGNRLVEISDGDRTTSVYDGANRLLKATSLSGITTYSYDAAGNRRSLQTPSGDRTTYTWNGENQLTQVELPTGDVVTYVWDPVNKLSEERVVTRDDGVTPLTYLWDNNNVLRETDDVGTVEAEYTYQPEPYGDLVSQRRDADSRFYWFDALGSTTALTDADGVIVAEDRYTAFGQSLTSMTIGGAPYTWLGKIGYRSDAPTALFVLRARFYDPYRGTCLSLDPMGLETGATTFYWYVQNNPVNETDPSGLFSLSPQALIGPTLCGAPPAAPVPPASICRPLTTGRLAAIVRAKGWCAGVGLPFNRCVGEIFQESVLRAIRQP